VAESKILGVKLIRLGDLSTISVIRLHTKDGSARQKTDYEPIDQEVRFGVGMDTVEIPVKIMKDDKKEDKEVFYMLLSPSKKKHQKIRIPKAQAIVEILVRIIVNNCLSWIFNSLF
jgi:hypothetical protein